MGKSQPEIFLRGCVSKKHSRALISPASQLPFHSMQKLFAHAIVRFYAFVAVSLRQPLIRIIVIVDLNEQF